MKRFLALLLGSGLFVAAHCVARADAPSVWGFPLGVTADELRAAKGAPVSVRHIQPHAPLFPGMPTPKPTNNESWEYDSGGARFYVLLSDGRTRTVEISRTFTADLSSEPSSTMTDPMGLKIGDTLGAILIKSGAVKEIEPDSGIHVQIAMLDVTRGTLHYQFQITSGLIQTEWVTLLSSP